MNPIDVDPDTLSEMEGRNWKAEQGFRGDERLRELTRRQSRSEIRKSNTSCTSMEPFGRIEIGRIPRFVIILIKLEKILKF